MHGLMGIIVFKSINHMMKIQIPYRIRFFLIGMLTGIILIITSVYFFLNSIFGMLDPIEEYHFTANVQSLENVIFKVPSKNKNITIENWQEVGKGERQAWHVDVVLLKGKYSFNIRYEKEESFWHPSRKTKLSLSLIRRLSDGKVFSEKKNGQTEEAIKIFEGSFLQKI